MFTFHKKPGNQEIAEFTDDKFLITHVQDALDLLAEAGVNGCSRIIIHEKNFHPDFFDLKTRLAGDILQKFSNYHVKLAIIGYFPKYESKSMQDFIRESNKGNAVYFVDSLAAAIARLSK